MRLLEENIKMIYEYSDIEYNKVKDKSVNTWDTCIIAKYQEKSEEGVVGDNIEEPYVRWSSKSWESI